MIRIRMSQAGYCSKRLVSMLLGREGTPTPNWLDVAAQEGNWHESRLVSELRELGCVVVDQQLEVRLPTKGNYEVVGHIDGRVRPSYKLLHDSLFVAHYINCSPSDITESFYQHLYLGEMKTFSYLEHRRWLEEGFDGYFKPYAVQHTLYRHALNETGFTLLFSKDRSGGARNLYVIGKDPADFIELPPKFDEVVRCAEAGEFPPNEYNSESLECRRCNYRTSVCLGQIPKVDEAAIIAAAQDYLDGSSQEKEGKALKEMARDILIAYAIRSKKLRWVAGDYPITYSAFPREDVSVGPVRDVIKRLEQLVGGSGDVALSSIPSIIEDLKVAISSSQIRRITVTNSHKED